jgi:putative endonuclease
MALWKNLLGKIKKAGSTSEKGRIAEQLAVETLEENGYRILERNFKCKIGEIDVIARHAEYLVFVEVRSGLSPLTVNPAYSVNRTKQRKIFRAAQVYLDRNFRQYPACRFDVVIVSLVDSPKVEIIPDAFTMDYEGVS